MEQQLYELLYQCTVRVSIPGKTGHGTGFFVAPSLILTCAHVIKIAQPYTTSVEVYWHRQLYPVQITKFLPDHDLALLQVNLAEHPCVYFREEAIPFDALYSYGYPDNYSNGDPTTFSLEGKAGEEGEQLKFKTGQVRPGLSGAPLLNIRTGYVCGIVQLTRDRNNDLGGRAIPLSTVLRFFPELIVQQRQFHQNDKRWTNCLWEAVAHSKYLEGVIRRYRSVALPIGPTQGFSLQAIFQPLKLRRDPLAAEDLVREERRALLGELRYSDTDPRYVFPDISRSPNPGQQPPPVVIAENIHEALEISSKHSIIVLGGPGTGKTVLLQYLIGDRAQKALTDPKALMPVFISLPDLARSGKTLKEYLVYLIQDMMVDERYSEIIWKAIEQGHAFVCLDSLDEVAPKLRPEKIKLINEWASSTSSIYIVGSRFTEYKGGLLGNEQFTEWELLPMTSIMRQELAKRLLPELYRLMHPEHTLVENSVSAFADMLEKHEQAAAWGENPLLFSLTAVVFVHTGMLPSSRITLYQHVINSVLEIREPNRTQQEMLRSILACLSLEMYQEKGRTFTRNDLLRLLRVVRKRHDEQWNTEEIGHRIIGSGILEVVAYDTYGFRHQTFQEYLAALELAQRLNSRDQAAHEQGWKFAWSKRTYSRWIEVLRLMVGVLVQHYGRRGVQNALLWLKTLVQQRRSSIYGDPGDMGLILALKPIAEITESSVMSSYNAEMENLEDEIIAAWIEGLFSTAGQGMRWERLQSFVKEFAHLNVRIAKTAIDLLEVAINDWNPDVRKLGVQILGKLGKHTPIERLIEIVLNDTQPEVRRFALQALVEMREYATIKELIIKLNNSNTEVRIEGLRVLGKMGSEAPVELLLTALGDKNGKVRSIAAATLGELGEYAPVEPLINALHDSNRFVRVQVLRALGNLGRRVPIEPLLDIFDEGDTFLKEVLEETLIKVLAERTPIDLLLSILHKGAEVSVEAAKILGSLGEKAPLESIIAALKAGHMYVRILAIQVIEDLGSNAPIGALVEALDDDVPVLNAAVRALGKLGIYGPIERLVGTWDDYIWWMRAVAAEILGNAGIHTSVKPLVAVLNDGDARVKIAVIEALGKLGERVPVKSLTAVLNDEDAEIRIAVVEALGKLGERVPVKSLIAVLNDKDAKVRIAVIEALGKLGEQVPVELLVAALNDENTGIRVAAMYALYSLGKQKIIEQQLMVALNDRQTSVRMAAIHILKDRVPLEILLAILDNKNEFMNLRVSAIHALGALGEKAPLERLLTSLNDEHVCIAAGDVLGKMGSRVPIEPILAALNDDRHLVQTAALVALDKLGERTPVEPLLAALISGQGDRESVVRVLVRMGKRVPVEPLLTILDNQDWHVRVYAAKLLIRLGIRVPIKLLIDALNSVDDAIRLASVEALGDLKEPESVASLLNALKDSAVLVRAGAASALAKLERHVPVEPLVAALGDSNQHVRKVVVRVLRETHPDILPVVSAELVALLERKRPSAIVSSLAQCSIANTISSLENASPSLLDKLAQLLDWPYWEVQMKAAEALGKLRRNIPDIAIERLYTLRIHSQSRAVREAADNALSEILSLETGIEDE